MSVTGNMGLVFPEYLSKWTLEKVRQGRYWWGACSISLLYSCFSATIVTYWIIYIYICKIITVLMTKYDFKHTIQFCSFNVERIFVLSAS